MKEPTIINKRPLVFLALALMAGIATSFLVIQNKLLFWIIFGVGLLLFGGFFVFNKKRLIAFCVLFFTIGFIGHFIQYNTTIENFNAEEKYFVQGKIIKISKGEDYDSITLKNLEVDGFSVKGRAMLKIYEENALEVFDVVEIYGYIQNKDLSILNKYTRSHYGNGVYYDVESIGFLNIKTNQLTFFERLRRRMIYPMDSFMTSNNKGIANSLLFGDLSFINREDLNAARVSGLGHIFAVSGLHIGFIVALFVLIMKKIRLNRWISFGIMTAILVIYCAITAFPPSAVRASIMAVVYLLSNAVYKKSDGLSSLAMASVVMLLVSPRSLFSLSFIMSLSAVLGILLYCKPIYNYFVKESKNRFRKAVSGSASLSISANVFLLPISLNVFGFVSLYFVLANLIVLPIVSLSYIMLFLTGFLSVIWQRLGIFYFFANGFLELIRLITLALSKLPFASVSSSGLGIFSLAYVLIMMLLSRYILLNKNQKLTIFGGIMLIGVILYVAF